MSILDNLPIKFLKWYTEHVGYVSINSDYIDINTGMKSDLHIYYEDGQYIAKMRYDDSQVLETFSDLHYAIRSCEYGRGFMGDNIIELYNKGFGELDDEIFS